MKTSAYSGFIDRKHRLSRKEFEVEFSLKPARGISFETAAQMVAGESSIGTWTDIGTLNERIVKTLKPSIFYLNKARRTIKIAYPQDLFEPGNIPQVLSSIAGNVFGMKDVASLRLEDINFPDSFIKKFKGPRFGIKGVRKKMKVKKRPLVGTIVKPKLGLTAREHAGVAFNSWLGGCDFVKDDENLSSMSFNKFEKRLKETLRLRAKAEKITGERKEYFPNVTAPYKEMLKRAKLAHSRGSAYAMVDIITVGWSALQQFREECPPLILHAHRAGHAAFTRSKDHGISMLVLAKLCRLIGMDQLHVGAIVGKMVGAKQEVQAIGEEIEERVIQPNRKNHVLAENWLKLKPTLAVCSGGLHPGKVPPLIKAMGRDIVIQMGGGIHGHPSGSLAGARAARQAVDASMKKVSLKQYARTHSELEAALKKWG